MPDFLRHFRRQQQSRLPHELSLLAIINYSRPCPYIIIEQTINTEQEVVTFKGIYSTN